MPDENEPVVVEFTDGTSLVLPSLAEMMEDQRKLEAEFDDFMESPLGKMMFPDD